MVKLIKAIITIIWIIDVLDIGKLGTTILDKTVPLNTGFWFIYALFIGLGTDDDDNNNKDKK